MILEYKYKIGSKVVTPHINSEGFTIIETTVASIEVINSCTPYIVYRLTGVNGKISESKIFSDREELSESMAMKAKKLAFSEDTSTLGSFF